MAEQGLRPIVVKKYNHHANHGSIPDDKKNILGPDFGTEAINQKWCTDIIYIHVQKEGWTYLASVMDLCIRKTIGYAYGASMTAGLAVKAVGNAYLNARDAKGALCTVALEASIRARHLGIVCAEKGSCIHLAVREIHKIMRVSNHPIPY